MLPCPLAVVDGIYGFLPPKTLVVTLKTTFTGLSICECFPLLHVPNSATQIFLVAPSLEDTIPVDKPYIHAVCAGEELVDQLAEANNRNLKGVVFKRLCCVACREGLGVFEMIRQTPRQILDFIGCSGR